MSNTKINCRRIDMKRKCYTKGKSQKFKRFKRMPKFIRDNVENQIAKEKEKDIYEFSDSEEDERANELGMGLEISDLPLLNGDDFDLDKQKAVLALTQDAVAPLFKNESEYDERKLDEALGELRHSQFRPNQKETIKRILMGRSTLFISPTGSGKSLCYQMPALLYWRERKYITIVVSPLISLMEDQIKNIPPMLRAVSIHSNQNRQLRRNSFDQLIKGEAQIVFITPEAIVGGLLELSDLKNLPAVGFVCIDEAHCLSDWSHNFRPAYMQFMRILNEHLNIKTFLALTATATRATMFGISRCLTINPETDVIGSTTIPQNLILSVSYETNKEHAIIELLKSPTFRVMPSIIVYCSRREQTEKVASNIRTAMQNYSSLIDVPERIKKDSNEQRANNESNQVLNDENNLSPESRGKMKLTWNSEAYHAGLTSQTRARIQRQFIKGEIRVVVATIAFGMGINKSNVRAIIHYDMPSSFESYVQEIGRAGRDGKPAQCHMFLEADKSDVCYQQRNIYSSVTETGNLDKLSGLIFKPCRCRRMILKAEQEKLNKLNEADRHEIRSWQKTTFTDTPVLCNEDDLDGDLDYEVPCNIDSKENQPMKFTHKSIVEKHRPCKGHEVAFSVDEATEATNLYPEAIITFICKLEQAYPQLHIKQFAPTKPKCTLLCYKGPEQMDQLATTCPAVREALFYLKQEHMITHGSNVAYETPKKIVFDITRVAQRLAKSSNDVIRMLKQIEWELNDETGRFRRSHVRVSFDCVSFHLTAVGDLTHEETKEINKFLADQMRKYERIEREKIMHMYQTLRQFAINIDQMKDKITRIQISFKLKAALNAHFDPNGQNYSSKVALSDPTADGCVELSPPVEAAIRKKASEFISAHGTDFSSRAIAKIFQGVSCPNYPAEHWGMNRNFWRTFVDVDFLKLTEVIQNVMLKKA